MQVETERYIKGIHQGVDWIIKQNKVKPVVELPKWQIDFEKYGGRAMYEVIKGMYWERFELRKSTKFELKNECLTPDIYDLMVMFRSDINKQLDIPREEILKKINK